MIKHVAVRHALIHCRIHWNISMKWIVFLGCFAVATTGHASMPSTEVDAFLKQKMAAERIPALQVAVVRHNQIVKSSAYGIASVEHGVAATNETVFSINSCTKAFTGVAIMQLAEEGKLNLDDPVSKYLNDLPEAWRRITIKQVLAHVSGLPNIMDGDEKLVGDGSDESAG